MGAKVLGALAALHRPSGFAGLGRVCAALFVLLGLVAGCGGGGSDSPPPPPPPPFTYTMSTGAVGFEGKVGDPTPTAQTATINITSPGGGYVSVGTPTGNFFSWDYILHGSVGTVIRITPQAPTVAGEFSGSLPIRLCRDSTCNTVERTIVFGVFYRVRPEYLLESDPVAADFETSPGVAVADRSLQLSVSNGLSLSWAHSVAYTAGSTGWLTVSPASAGTLTSPVTLRANVAGLPLGRHTAEVTFTAGISSLVVPVSFTVHAPAVNFVAPYVATTGTSAEVVLRGYGFSAVASGLQVSFGGTPATAARVVSNTEIRATHPVLAAGSHAVGVGNVGSTLASRARLLVMSPQAYPAAAIPRPASGVGIGSLIHDAERRALYVIGGYDGRLESYRFNGAGWASSAPVTVGGEVVGNRRLALAPDGSELIQTAGTSLWRIDPATLAVLGSVSAAQALRAPFINTNMIDFANDGHAIGNASSGGSQVHLYRYNLLTRQFALIPTPPEGPQPDMTNRYIVASGNGASLWMPTFNDWPVMLRPAYHYDASTYVASNLGVGTSGMLAVSVNRDGSRAILLTREVATVYGAGMLPRGTLANPALDMSTVAISPDGTRAYAYYRNTQTLRTFDLSTPSGGGFAELGAARTLADAPGGDYHRMTLSADGGTLFLGGSERILVITLP